MGGSMSDLNRAIERFFTNSSDPILFAGAGVSAKVGILTWGPLLERLKEWIRSRDPLTANQMAERIYKQDFITAADYFFFKSGSNRWREIFSTYSTPRWLRCETLMFFSAFAISRISYNKF